VKSLLGPLGSLPVRTVWIIRPGLDGSRRRGGRDGRCHDGDGQRFQVRPVLDSEERELE
jgi:hypothetical protein